MALRSQVARQGIRWRYMAGGSYRRRGKRWPWALLSLVIMAGVTWFIWQGSRGSQGAAVAAGDSSDTAAVSGETASSKAATQSVVAEPAAGYQLPSPNQTRGAAGGALPADRVWTLDGNKANGTAAASAGGHAGPGVSSGVLPSTGQARAASGQQPSQAQQQPSQTVGARVVAGGGAQASGQPQQRAMSQVSGGDVEAGFSLIEQGRRVEGRKLLSKLLVEGALTPAQAQKARDVLTNLSYMMIYTPRYFPEDPLTSQHVVKRGDRLTNMAIAYKTPYQFIEKINGIDANRIQLDQKIKVVNGPFHAVVSKSAFRMDLYLVDPADGQRIYIRSFAVGLGADDSTPLGDWVIKPRSKVENPAWTNPRTGEHFKREDPANPIGEFWMALEGLSRETASLSGYGIHGTVEPDSIGTQSSMGCIRLRDEDIAQVYYMFWEGDTTVKVVP